MKEIQLTQGKATKIDDEDFERVSLHKWHAQRSAEGKYHVAADITNEEGKSVRAYLHNFIGNPPSGYSATHKDRDSLNNQKDNLVICVHGQNPGSQKNDGKYLGVYPVAKGKMKWRALITINGKTKHLGTFEAPEDAATARDDAAFEQWGKHALFNFPRVSTEASQLSL